MQCAVCRSIACITVLDKSRVEIKVHSLVILNMLRVFLKDYIIADEVLLNDMNIILVNYSGKSFKKKELDACFRSASKELHITFIMCHL